MITNLSPAAVDTKTAPREFWTRYHAYRRLRHAETRPNDPVKPDELVEIEMKHKVPSRSSTAMRLRAMVR